MENTVRQNIYKRDMFLNVLEKEWAEYKINRSKNSEHIINNTINILFKLNGVLLEEGLAE